jgi:predicted proteasome-type protease
MQIHENGSFTILHEKRIEADDPDLVSLSSAWDTALAAAFGSLPPLKLGV